MKNMRRATILIALLTVSLGADTVPQRASAIDWKPWSDAVFDQAKREN
jgi:hypothetical protein